MVWYLKGCPHVAFFPFDFKFENSFQNIKTLLIAVKIGTTLSQLVDIKIKLYAMELTFYLQKLKNIAPWKLQFPQTKKIISEIRSKTKIWRKIESYSCALGSYKSFLIFDACKIQS